MGSNKYPDENGFDAFVSKHGGYTNASTDCERVCVIQILQYSILSSLDCVQVQYSS